MELLKIDNHVRLRQIKNKSKEAQIKGIQEHGKLSKLLPTPCEHDKSKPLLQPFTSLRILDKPTAPNFQSSTGLMNLESQQTHMRGGCGIVSIKANERLVQLMLL